MATLGATSFTMNLTATFFGCLIPTPRVTNFLEKENTVIFERKLSKYGKKSKKKMKCRWQLLNEKDLVNKSGVHTSDGRMDAAVTTASHIYILEFKLDESAAAALKQIHEKAYADKYRLEGKTVVGVGINFSSKKKAVDDWKQAVLVAG